jgi:hypothetical protein
MHASRQRFSVTQTFRDGLKHIKALMQVWSVIAEIQNRISSTVMSVYLHFSFMTALRDVATEYVLKADSKK